MSALFRRGIQPYMHAWCRTQLAEAAADLARLRVQLTMAEQQTAAMGQHRDALLAQIDAQPTGTQLQKELDDLHQELASLRTAVAAGAAGIGTEEYWRRRALQDRANAVRLEDLLAVAEGRCSNSHLASPPHPGGTL